MKLLVVDDDRDLVELLEYALRREGYEVARAYDGEAALAAVERERPDLIVLDLSLPTLAGFVGPPPAARPLFCAAVRPALGIARPLAPSALAYLVTGIALPGGIQVLFVRAYEAAHGDDLPEGSPPSP